MLQFLTTDSLPWSSIFLILMLAVNALTWLARDTVGKRLAFVLFLAWISENFLHDRLGGNAAPLLALADLALLGLVLAVGYRVRSWTAFYVAALFAFDQAILWGSAASRQPANGLLFATLNLVYLVQLVIVGGASARLVAASVGLHWLPRRGVAVDRQVRG